MKVCTICNANKKLEDFCINRTCVDGRNSQCRSCVSEYNRSFMSKQANKDKKKNNQLIRKYGITLKEWQALYDAQDGKCAVCGNEPTRFMIDHEHVTNYAKLSAEEKKQYIRGGLCFRCNYAFLSKGMTVEIANNIVKYLTNYEEKHEEQTSA